MTPRRTALRQITQALALTALATSGHWALAAEPADAVVYHFDQSATQATRGLRSLRNHLDMAPQTKIVVVAVADGVDFLMEGAKDAKNANLDYAALVSDLRARGVRFEVCELTLRQRGLKREQFTLDAEYVPSGVVRITQLQTREGYAYVKP